MNEKIISALISLSGACGNTSDYDMNKFHNNEELKPLKEELLRETVDLVRRINYSQKSDLPEEIYRVISFFGYELAENSYRYLIEALKQKEV